MRALRLGQRQHALQPVEQHSLFAAVHWRARQTLGLLALRASPRACVHARLQQRASQAQPGGPARGGAGGDAIDIAKKMMGSSALFIGSGLRAQYRQIRINLRAIGVDYLEIAGSGQMQR